MSNFSWGLIWFLSNCILSFIASFKAIDTFGLFVGLGSILFVGLLNIVAGAFFWRDI